MSKYGIIKLMDPWAGLADDDEAADRYMELGELTEEKYRQIIKQDLVPYYCSLPEKKRLDLLNKLKIALEDKKCNFEREFNSVLPPFEPPEDPKQFFVWIYEELQGIGEA
jgi:hypothetical protein